MLPYFDTHTHMQDARYVPFLGAIIDRAEKQGVKKILSCGVMEKDWGRLTDLARDYDCIVPAYGLHPWFISARSPGWLERLETHLKQPGVFAGEAGLDRMIDRRNDEDQKTVFIEQLRLANSCGKPMSIHCRSAWGILDSILKKEGGLPYGGVIHSYSGSADMVHVLEKHGASISFSGSATKSANKKVKAAAKAVSPDRLLVETDSPDILPENCGDGLNEPANIPVILKAVSDIRGEKEDETAQRAYENALALFG